MNIYNTIRRKRSQKESTLEFQLFRHLPTPTLIVNDNGVIVMVNEAFMSLSGYSEEEIIDLEMSIFKKELHRPSFYKELSSLLSVNGFYEGEVWGHDKDGKSHLLKEKIKRVEHDDTSYYICMFDDITKSRELVEQYRYLAMHDVLTGLANRTLATDRFNHALVNSLRVGEHLGILLCDLNEFKQVNDTYGHHIGDLFLVEIASRLSGLVREGDTVARIGGDEFLIIIEHLKDPEELKYLREKIDLALQKELNIEGEVMHANMCIGSAVSPQDGMSYENLLKIADSKMYREKECFYGLTELVSS